MAVLSFEIIRWPFAHIMSSKQIQSKLPQILGHRCDFVQVMAGEDAGQEEKKLQDEKELEDLRKWKDRLQVVDPESAQDLPDLENKVFREFM